MIHRIHLTPTLPLFHPLLRHLPTLHYHTTLILFLLNHTRIPFHILFLPIKIFNGKKKIYISSLASAKKSIISDLRSVL